jgi:hypothetical protein
MFVFRIKGVYVPGINWTWLLGRKRPRRAWRHTSRCNWWCIKIAKLLKKRPTGAYVWATVLISSIRAHFLCSFFLNKRSFIDYIAGFLCSLLALYCRGREPSEDTGHHVFFGKVDHGLVRSLRMKKHEQKTTRGLSVARNSQFHSSKISMNFSEFDAVPMDPSEPGRTAP